MNATTKILAVPEESSVRRKPRIMIAGEFSAGKSRLINALMGKDVLPSNVTSTALPPIWMIYGDRPPLVVGIDGKVMDLDMGDIDVETTAFCVVSSKSKILEHMDLIDTPGNSDPKIPAICWERMVQYADSLVWCTSAMQAWKQTEKATCADLPEDLLENATLLITQADRMPDERSAEKVERRVSRDASKYFSTIMMGSMLDEFDAKRVRDRLMDISGNLPLRGAEEELVDEVREDVPEAEAQDDAEAWNADTKEEAIVKPTRISALAEEPVEAETMAEAEAIDAAPVVDGFSVETEDEPSAADASVTEDEAADEAVAVDADTVSETDEPSDEATEAAVAEVVEDETPESDTEADAEAPVAEEDTDAAEGDAPELEDAPADAIAANVKAAMEDATSFGQPDGTFAGMWRRITADTELSDNERFMSCVATLLEEVRELIRANEDASSRRDNV